jgi:hypothetical protein
MISEPKIILALAGVIALLLAASWGGERLYHGGMVAGKAEIQVKWDADLAARQKITDLAIAQATKERDIALSNNEETLSDANTQIANLRDLNTSLAARLRNIQSIGAGSGTLSQGSNKPDPVAGAGKVTMGQIDDAIAATLTECAVNRTNYSALIKELKPQL